MIGVLAAALTEPATETDPSTLAGVLVLMAVVVVVCTVYGWLHRGDVVEHCEHATEPERERARTALEAAARRRHEARLDRSIEAHPSGRR